MNKDGQQDKEETKIVRLQDKEELLRKMEEKRQQYKEKWRYIENG